MRDRVYWLPRDVPCACPALGKRKVYVAHHHAPFVGFMAAADTAFSIPAYVRYKGKRLTGFVTPRDGMAFQQEHDSLEFRLHEGEWQKCKA